MKITKSKLAQIIQEELGNTVSEVEQWSMGRSMKADDLAADPLYAAENQGIVDAQDDFMRYERGEEVSSENPSFGSQEEEEAYGMAWGKEYNRLMDIAAKNAVERKLNRPPEPMTDADREAADAELDFEATFSEGKTKITKSKLAQIVQEELSAVKAEGYKAYSRDDDERIYPKKELSRHARDMTKNVKKGYSPQAAITAIPDHEEGMKIYFNSLSKKPKRESQLSESDVDPVEAGQDEDIQEMIYQQIADNLQDGPLPADNIFSLTKPEYESPYEHLADQWEDILEAALHEMSEGADATIEKSHDTMTGEPYYSPIGFLS